MNDYRATARALKAEAIASTFIEYCGRAGVAPTVELLDKLDDSVLDTLTRVAQQRKPSEETWTVVRAIVARRLQTASRGATVNPDGSMDGS